MNQKELKAALNDQAAINESLCTENIVGRWAWKSGELKSGNSIPWEIQLANTLPDNFLWEKDKSSVLAVAPGLYEVRYPLVLEATYTEFRCFIANLRIFRKEKANNSSISEWGVNIIGSKHSFVIFFSTGDSLTTFFPTTLGM